MYDEKESLCAMKMNLLKFHEKKTIYEFIPSLSLPFKISFMLNHSDVFLNQFYVEPFRFTCATLARKHCSDVASTSRMRPPAPTLKAARTTTDRKPVTSTAQSL